jgi:addiction module HigA family antidote
VARRLLHPGEVLREEFMDPLDISINGLARSLSVPVSRISAIVNEKRAISPDTALMLAKYFGTSAQFWVNLQTAYDLKKAEKESRGSIRKIIPYEVTRMSA